MSDMAGNNSGKRDPLADAAQRAEEAVNQTTTPDSPPGSYGTGFGEIDLGGDTQTPELDLAEPPPKKPSLATPALLQDEQWDDDGWANDQPGMAPVVPDAPVTKPSRPEKNEEAKNEKAKPQPQKLRKAVLPPKGKSAIEQEQQTPQPTPQEKEGPFIRVSGPDRPKRDWGPVIKWTSIIVIAAACIAGAIIGYSKWRQGVQAKEQAQLDALNQGSLQSLKSKAVKKGKLGS